VGTSGVLFNKVRPRGLGQKKPSRNYEAAAVKPAPQSDHAADAPAALCLAWKSSASTPASATLSDWHILGLGVQSLEQVRRAKKRPFHIVGFVNAAKRLANGQIFFYTTAFQYPPTWQRCMTWGAAQSLELFTACVWQVRQEVSP